MIKKKGITKCLSLFMAMAFCTGNLMPLTVKAETVTEEKNVIAGLEPTTNAEGGILNPLAATDGNKAASNVDSNNTKIVAGEETGTEDNGYAQWQQVYLEYDLGESYNLQEISLYRNTYDDAVSTFKDVKVEIASDKEFTDSKVVYGTADVEETTENKGQAQTIGLPEGTEGRYLRIWGKGHYIQNTNSNWKGYSNGVLFNEIEVIASVPKSEVPAPPPEAEAKNIAAGKIPYVRGLVPTNIKAITDGKADDNYAVHNSLGKRWLQFEYKNSYFMKEIKFKLEEGTYKSVEVSVSSAPANNGEVVFNESNWTQGEDMTVIDLGEGKPGKYVRFTVNKEDNSPTKYSEIEIWATGKNFDESKPEYVAPESKYDTLERV